MGTWWLEYALDGFIGELPILPYSLFRVLFGLCCLIKWVVEWHRGYLHYFQSDSFLHYRCEHSRSPARRILAQHSWIYETALWARLVGALGCLIGVAWPVSTLLLAAGLLVEIIVYNKFHTQLFLLIVLCLAASPSAFHLLTITDAVSLTRGSIDNYQAYATGKQDNVWGQVLILLTMTMVYIVSAAKKAQREFLSGIVLRDLLRFMHEERGRRCFRDSCLPPGVIRYLAYSSSLTSLVVLRTCAIGTVVLEVAVPVMLLNEQTLWAAIIMGSAMHAAFTILFPGTLLHFSLCSVSTFVLFIDPRSAVGLLR